MNYDSMKYLNMVFFCRNCGQDITHKPSNRRKFCNSKCHNEWQRRTCVGTKYETRECLECKKSFACKPADEKKFCCSSCAAKHTNRDRAINHPEVFLKVSAACKKAYAQGKMTGFLRGHELTKQRAKPLVNKICPVCGKKYTIRQSKENAGSGKYCSRECCYRAPGRGGYRPGSVRNYKSGWHESPIAGRVWMDSSYEFIVAEYLDGKNYKWIKNTKGFPYRKIEDGVERDANYVPDFYIEDLDLWVETKGYFVENDQRKLDAFPHKIKLITKKTIYDKTTWGF